MIPLHDKQTEMNNDGRIIRSSCGYIGNAKSSGRSVGLLDSSGRRRTIREITAGDLLPKHRTESRETIAAQGFSEHDRGVIVTNKIDTLLQRAKQATGEWRPDTYTVTKSGGRYRVVRTLWNGVAGSLNPGYLERHNIDPHHEAFFDSQEEARRWIVADIATFEKKHCIKLSPAPKVFNCCLPETDAERKALWKEQGGTVMEYLAEEAGNSLEAYILREFGEEKLEWYADIIRWRKEDEIDEKTAEAVNAARSSAGIDQNRE